MHLLAENTIDVSVGKAQYSSVLSYQCHFLHSDSTVAEVKEFKASSNPPQSTRQVLPLLNLFKFCTKFTPDSEKLHFTPPSAPCLQEEQPRATGLCSIHFLWRKICRNHLLQQETPVPDVSSLFIEGEQKIETVTSHSIEHIKKKSVTC